MMGSPDTIPLPASTQAPRLRLPKVYLGTFDRVVDHSGRVLLPTSFLEVGDREFFVVVWPVVRQPQFLNVLPPQEAERLQRQLGEYRLTDPEGNLACEAFASHCYPSALDKQGRLPIPEAAAQKLGIKGRVTLVGNWARFALWVPEHFTGAQADPARIAQTEKALDSRKI